MNALAQIINFILEAEDEDFDLKDVAEPNQVVGGRATVKRYGRFKIVDTPRYTFLISYLTPVAYYDKQTENYYQTSKQWSPTTNTHIGDWKGMIWKSPEWQANPDNKEESEWGGQKHISVRYPRFHRKRQAFISKLFREMIPQLQMKPHEKRRMYHVHPKMRQGSGLSKTWLSGHLKHHDSGDEGLPRPDDPGYEGFFTDFEPHEPEIFDWSSGLKNMDPHETGEDPLGEAMEDGESGKDLQGISPELLQKQLDTLLPSIIQAKERDYGRKLKKTYDHTNPHGERFLFGEFGRDGLMITLLFFDPEFGWSPIPSAANESLLDERAKTGIFMKQLDNGRQVFSSKCDCGVMHGGYRSYEEAKANKKCRRCYRGEIEKTRKEIEKVDEPKKQKDIFQNRMNKPAVIGEAYEDDDLKDVAEPLPDRPMYILNTPGREFYSVTRDGFISQFRGKPSGQWQMVGMTVQKYADTVPVYLPWQKLVVLLNQGEALSGKVRDLDHGTTREWGNEARIYKTSVNENFPDDDFGGDWKEVTNPEKEIGAVTKDVCVNARYGQEFWLRNERSADGVARRVRVSGKCQTWKTRPDEFKLPVKYGLYQSFYITNANAGEFSTVEPPPVKSPRRR